MNCWEFKECGRELGGKNTGKLKICPASTHVMLNGVHGGVNAGRACWVVAGTMCQGSVQGTFANKIKDCSACDFYSKVREEEGSNITMTFDLLEKAG